MNSTAEMKGAIIGAGFFAQFQAAAWNRIPQARITAVVDPDRQRAADFARQHRIPRVYASAEAMLAAERPDFVDIVTRPDSHLFLTRLCADHGAQVICQKPMAPTLPECLDMVEACRAAGVRLLIHENWRWQPWYREIRRLIDADTFGRVFHLGFVMRNGDGRGANIYPAQPYFREMPRLLLYETCVHFLDTFRYLAGEITSVYCQLNRINPLIAGEDYALAQMTFASGARGLLDGNRLSGPRVSEVAFGTLSLEGERAALRMTPQGDLWIHRYDEGETPHAYDKPVTGYKGDSVYALQQHFVECLLTGAACESEGAEYLKTVAALFACYESAETGLAITLSPTGAAIS